MKEQTIAYLDKSRELLDKAEAIFRANDYEDAGRAAYMAGLHAAQALIFETSAVSTKRLAGSTADLYQNSVIMTRGPSVMAGHRAGHQ